MNKVRIKNKKLVKSTTQIETFLKRHWHVLLWSFCVIGMLRVFIFSAAFPFFNNVDEQAHFDTVVKYSKGYLPNKEAVNFDSESAKLIVLYGSPEYLHTPQDFNMTEMLPPLWSLEQNLLSKSDKEDIDNFIKEQMEGWARNKNHEALSPPVYYTLAGVWYDIGKIAGFKGGYLLYWVRFLNIPLYGILFWVTCLLCKKIRKDDLLMPSGILLMLTFFPQDVFYSICSDVLSPLFCLWSLYLLIQISDSNRSFLFNFLTGMLVSAAFLVKLTNLPILIIFAVFIAFRVRTLINTERLKEQLPNLLFLVSGCLLPIICWLGWNAYALGDITGNAQKVLDFGWTVKKFGDMWDHPIFTFGGIALFGSELLKTFWRGEFVWGLKAIASVPVDYFYIISSCMFISISVINTIVSKTDYSPTTDSSTL